MKEIKLTCSLPLSTVAADLPPPGRRYDNVWKSSHKGFWRDAFHGELSGSKVGGWNTFDPQGVSLDRTLGKKDVDAGGEVLHADSRARVQWTSTSSSFLWTHFVGFAIFPRFWRSCCRTVEDVRGCDG